MKAGFIGLGAMGEPMARNLHQAGLLTAVWNRTAAKSDAFAGTTGCTAVDSIGGMAKHCDIVIICVSADADVLAVVAELAGALNTGSIVIDCSTVAAKTAREAADLLAKSDIAFLDCPVSGGTEGAQHGTLSIMVGGEPETVEKARPVLEAIGRQIVHIGPVGAGQATKAVNQIVVAGVNQAVSEALAFAAAEKLPLEKVIEAVNGGAAGSWFLKNRGPNMMRNEFPLGFKIALHKKDLEICKAMAGAHDVQLPVVEMTLVHYQRLIETGFGDEDVSALFRLKSDMFMESNA
ncbi:MAG: NAD(P)-dependent oxidoreductase [Gammaproteobacteria bacterium]|nr:NAD(P)-dependent oxidoreductase [Gammaproteobacteria bacterium]